MPFFLKYLICTLLLYSASCEKTTVKSKILEMVNREKKQADDKIIYGWLYRASQIIFAYSHRIILVVNENKNDMNSYGPKIVNELSTISVNLITDYYPLSNEDDNYVVISNDLNFFINVFDNNLHYKFAKYLIGTDMDEKNLEKLIEHAEAKEYAFVTIVSISNKIGRIYQYRASDPDSTGINRTQHLTMIFQRESLQISKEDLIADVEPYLNTICPVERCDLRANSLQYKTQMGRHAPKYTAIVTDNSVYDFIQIFADTTPVKDVYYPYNSSETWEELEVMLKDDSDGVDVIFGNLLAPANFSTFFDIVCVYKIKVYYFTSLLGDIKPNIGALLTPFDAEIWAYFAGTMIICVLFMFLTNFLNKKRLLREYGQAFGVLTILFEQTMKMPQHCGLRTVFGMWIIFAFFISAFYNSAFRTSLLDVDYGNHIETLGEIANDNDLAIGGYEAIKDFFNDPDDPVMLAIYNRYKSYSADELVNELIENQVTIALSDRGIENIARATQWNDAIKLYRLKQPIVAYSIFVYLKKGHPFINTLSTTAMKVFSTGIINFNNFTTYDLGTPYHDAKSNFIRLNQFVIAIYSYLIGILIALCAFVFEIHFHRLFVKKDKNRQLAIKVIEKFKKHKRLKESV